MTGDDGVRVFVSHAGPDTSWAEWVAWHLEAAGYVVELDRWHWSAGDDFVARMNTALENADVVLALLSNAYFESARFTGDEWRAVFATRGRLVPVRIEQVAVPPILAPKLFRDLFGLNEAATGAVLLEAVQGPSKPTSKPGFPGAAAPVVAAGGPRLPEVLPAVWKVPNRSAVFTGRDAMLEELRDLLRGGGRAAVRALHGWGGVGKTLLAVEYAHRYNADYDTVWWVDSENLALVPGQLAALAVAVGAVPAGLDLDTGLAAARTWLGKQSRWLLIFDNADDPRGLRELLPAGPGQVLVTSRRSDWAGIAAPVDVNVFSRTESVTVLREQVPTLTTAQADAIAAAVGDLPLALAQAAGVLANTGLSADAYLDELAAHAAAVLAEGGPATYPGSLAATVRIAADRLHADDLAAWQLLRVCARLAPEPIAIAWFSTAAYNTQESQGDGGRLPDPLRQIAGSPMALHNTAARLARYGLARITTASGGGELVVHRLIAAITRDTAAAADGAAWETAAPTAVVTSSTVGLDPRDPAAWPGWARLLPHLLALDPSQSTDTTLRAAAVDACEYLLARGAYSTALETTSEMHIVWSEAPRAGDNQMLRAEVARGHALRYLGRHEEAVPIFLETFTRCQHELGEDDPDTLRAARGLATAWFLKGDYAAARQLDEDTLTRYRQLHGADHPDTLASANSYAVDLLQAREHEAARELNEDTLTRRRRVLGEDHPDTLTSAGNLAVDLREAGEHEASRELNEDTLTRRRRVLGEEHPDTLRAAHNLAIDLSQVGEHEASRELNEDTLARYRQLHGADHPDTLRCANNLAVDLSQVGEHEAARELNEDTLTRRRRVLGEDHPDTLASAHNLAYELQEVGEHEAARELDEDTLTRRRRVLGEDHPDTLASAHNLAYDLRQVGEHEAARRLDEDTITRQRRVVLNADHPAAQIED